jgi:hypothetical protein
MNPFAELHVNISIDDFDEFNIFLIRSISLISLGGGGGGGGGGMRRRGGDPDLTLRRIQKNKK